MPAKGIGPSSVGRVESADGGRVGVVEEVESPEGSDVGGLSVGGACVGVACVGGATNEIVFGRRDSEIIIGFPARIESNSAISGSIVVGNRAS